MTAAVLVSRILLLFVTFLRSHLFFLLIKDVWIFLNNCVYCVVKFCKILAHDLWGLLVKVWKRWRSTLQLFAKTFYVLSAKILCFSFLRWNSFFFSWCQLWWLIPNLEEEVKTDTTQLIFYLKKKMSFEIFFSRPLIFIIFFVEYLRSGSDCTEQNLKKNPIIVHVQIPNLNKNFDESSFFSKIRMRHFWDF